MITIEVLPAVRFKELKKQVEILSKEALQQIGKIEINGTLKIQVGLILMRVYFLKIQLS
jgi:tetrahydromethanopterin S-methyltransferase subunit G